MPGIRETDAPLSAALAGLTTLLSRYGLGAVISLGLIYWLTVNLATTLAAMRVELQDHSRMSTFYSRQICYNTARDDTQARGCEPPGSPSK